MRGVISCLPVRKPTIQEVENCRWINLTLKADWDPHSDDFAENERKAQENELIAPEDVWDTVIAASLQNEQELLPRV